ncbi:3-hydroxymyristoyl/3-hydroxydecanoyl-(acyl carrier protein) dehydratase [Paenibacillus cellulosilyticus]|uniref:3-hydroxymyristoyl/3-hydroxydecanoyl-(Acyl carrier protein) dehydratase n=1 Tax=Paenibacillus cellulosilyticus TaxID=375489 RepID=A0A2V2YU88_9BACL|nr:hypothetical protein [Paenibacillus cellulosilyticus]PWW03187.1 3-hydroxymyristoyl/3-hydroxydecanoyl-(acyl carrier protein) dehydratase [Paenibacillus cellulosilyticus]QKS43677.1 hypothetical protein HUB94_03950 [Paenibacillus cellulosilyticus]
MNSDQLLSLIPQHPPFRFVDEIIYYNTDGNGYLTATFSPSKVKELHPKLKRVPMIILYEGIAQSSIILTQLMTLPLEDNELPVLGYMDLCQFDTPVEWEDEFLFDIKGIRFVSRKALMRGNISKKNGTIIASLFLSVATLQKGGGE